MGANVFDFNTRAPFTPYDVIPTKDDLAPPLPDDPDYDVWLDQYGSLVIGDSTFAASYVLRSLEPVTYSVMYEQYLEERKREAEEQRQAFRETVERYFPTPIAYNFHRLLHGWQNANQRLDILRDVWESLIYLMYALVMGEYRSRGLSMQGAEFFNRKKVFSFSLSDKLEIVEKLLTFGATAGYNLATARIIPVATVEKLRELNRVRNEFAHSVARSEREAIADYERHYGEVGDALQALASLQEVKLMRWVQSQRGVGAFRYEDHSGYATSPTKYDDMTVEAAQVGTVYPFLNQDNVLAKIGRDMFSVAPFLHFEQIGNSTHLCYFKRKPRENSTTMSYQVVDGPVIEIDEANFADAIRALDALLPKEQQGKTGAKQ